MATSLLCDGHVCMFIFAGVGTVASRCHVANSVAVADDVRRQNRTAHILACTRKNRFLIYSTCVFKCNPMLLARQAPDTCCLFLNIRKVAKTKKECCAVFSFLFLSAVPGLSEPQPCEKRLSHQLFLRLSRACLGKLIVLSTKLAQKGVFLSLSRACLGKMIVF
jgi:hypothetical protein